MCINYFLTVNELVEKLFARKDTEMNGVALCVARKCAKLCTGS